MSTASPSPASAAADLSASLSNLQISGNESAQKRLDIEAIATKIKNGEIKKVLVMTGAGISVSAGIPDFRSPKTGLYANLQKYNLPHPTAVFELEYFRRNPKPFYLLAKELYPDGTYRPTPTHYFLKVLEEQGILLKNYSQNIDGLELIAGLSPAKLIQAHGGFQSASCIECDEAHEEEYVRTHVFKDEIPRCRNNECGGLVKPKIVFFGEGLPEEFHRSVPKDFAQADLLIVMGTSLKVQPFCSLIDRVPKHVPRILINNELAGVSEDDEEEASNEYLATDPFFMTLRDQLNHLPPNSDMRPKIEGMLNQIRLKFQARKPSGLGFNFKDGKRDVFLQSDCDSGVMQLAKLIGDNVAKRLSELVEADRQKFKREDSSDCSSNEAKLEAGAAQMAKAIAESTLSNNPVSASSSSSDSTATKSSSSSSTTSAASHPPPFGFAFDFDHTLGMDHGLEFNAVQNYMRLILHGDALKGDIDQSTKKGIEGALRKFRDGQTSELDMLREVGKLDGCLNEQQLASISVENYHEQCYKLVAKTTANPGANELLQLLSDNHIPTAVLTNGWSPLQQKKIAHSLGEIAPKNILVSDQLKAIKPAKEAFDALANCDCLKSVPRQHIYFVGDNALTDVVAAMDNGMQGIWMQEEGNSYPEGKPQPLKIIQSLTELKPFVEGLLRAAKL